MIRALLSSRDRMAARHLPPSLAGAVKLSCTAYTPAVFFGSLWVLFTWISYPFAGQPLSWYSVWKYTPEFAPGFVMISSFSSKFLKSALFTGPA